MLGSGQTCKFFQNREKSEKGVFIAAPVKLKPLVDLTKSIIEEAGYEPVFASEIKEYNRFAFCNNICRPMLEAAIVVVIGDWEGNQGNANVAFEYGIATAMGCQVIPIRIKNKAGGPFDMLSLESIILAEDWMKPEKIEEFKNVFRVAFEKSRATVELKTISRELSQTEKTQLTELISQFWHTLEPETRKTLLHWIRRTCSNVAYYSDDAFLQWIVDVTVDYAKSFAPEKYPRARIGVDDLNEIFVELLNAAVGYNSERIDSPLMKDPAFAGALGFITMNDKVPAFMRAGAVSSLVTVAELTGDQNMLVPIFRVIENPGIDDKTYDSMFIGSRLRSYTERAISKGRSVVVLLGLLRKLKMSDDARILGRAKALETSLRFS